MELDLERGLAEAQKVSLLVMDVLHLLSHGLKAEVAQSAGVATVSKSAKACLPTARSDAKQMENSSAGIYMPAAKVFHASPFIYLVFSSQFSLSLTLHRMQSLSVSSVQTHNFKTILLLRQ